MAQELLTELQKDILRLLLNPDRTPPLLSQVGNRDREIADFILQHVKPWFTPTEVIETAIVVTRVMYLERKAAADVPGTTRTYRITVNGLDVKWTTKNSKISFSDIAMLAGINSNYLTMTYCGMRRGDSQRSGMMTIDGHVELEDGMIFNAVETGNA